MFLTKKGRQSQTNNEHWFLHYLPYALASRISAGHFFPRDFLLRNARRNKQWTNNKQINKQTNKKYRNYQSGMKNIVTDVYNNCTSKVRNYTSCDRSSINSWRHHCIPEDNIPDRRIQEFDHHFWKLNTSCDRRSNNLWQGKNACRECSTLSLKNRGVKFWIAFDRPNKSGHSNCLFHRL